MLFTLEMVQPVNVSENVCFRKYKPMGTTPYGVARPVGSLTVYLEDGAVYIV